MSQSRGPRYTHQGEVLSTPFCGLLACMPIENGKEALTTDASKRNDYGMRVLHGPPRPLRVGDGAFEGKTCGEIGVTIAGNGYVSFRAGEEHGREHERGKQEGNDVVRRGRLTER